MNLEIQRDLSGQERRPYRRLTEEEKLRIKAEYNAAARGQKGKTADKLAADIGCCRSWVIKFALGSQQ